MSKTKNHTSLLLALTPLIFSGCQKEAPPSLLEGNYISAGGKEQLNVEIRHVAAGQATLRAKVTTQESEAASCLGDTDVLPAKVHGYEVSVVSPDCSLTFKVSEDGVRAEVVEGDCSMYHGSGCSFDASGLVKAKDENADDAVSDHQSKELTQAAVKADNSQIKDVFSEADAWHSDWGNGIQGIVEKIKCSDLTLKDAGYTYLAYATIPTSRVKNDDQIWSVIDDRAVTVLGCWKYFGNGKGHYRMFRKSDAKVFDDDVTLNDGRWFSAKPQALSESAFSSVASEEASNLTLALPPPISQVQAAPSETSAVPNDYADYPYYAEITCTVNKNRLLVSACFNGNIPGGTEIELRNGNDYGLYKFYEVMRLGKQVNNALIINLHEHFSIAAQPSNNRMILGVRIADRASGETLFEKQTTFFQMITISN